MIRWFVLFCLLPLTLSAQPVTIRSGEHETFSRLVIAIGEGTDWAVTPTEGGYLLELTGRAAGFDVAEVFERIPRERLKDVAQRSPDTLFLAVDCPCDADAFLWRPGQLVVDIVDSPLSDQASAMIPPLVRPVMGPLPSDAPLRLPNPLEFSASPSLPMALVDGVEADRSADQIEASPEVLATQTALIEGLARAASQGILDAAVTATADPVEPVEKVAVMETPVVEPEPMVQPQQPGVGITTAMDRDFAAVRDAIEARVEQRCLPADLFQIAEWADERAFHEQAAAMAEALAGEFGEEPREGQDALARLYLHFGFGAEARAVLAADNAQSQARQVMMQLAGIVDDYDEDYALIAGQAGCETPAALWAFLVGATALDDAERNHILQHFFGLPRPLRGQIAPRLARTFIDINDPESAAKVLSAADNSDAEMTHDVQATRAVIAEEMEDQQDAIAILSEEIDDNARATPDSLIRLIELGLGNGIPVKEADLVLAAAMRQEFRDLPIADKLAVAEASGRVSLGQYQAALDLLEGREDEAAHGVIDQAYAHLTQQASAAIFLEFGYRDLPNGLTFETENAVARRMIDTGFPERAVQILRAPAEREAAAERRYLRAEAAIKSGDHVAAIDGLLGMSDQRARALRTQAYAGLGEYRAALSAADQNAANGSDPTLQFRAGAWERLTIQDDDVLSAFAQSVLVEGADTPSQSLADRRALLAQSQESRRAVEGLLLRFDGGAAQE